MPHAIQMTEYGPPSVLEWVETDSRPLDPEEVRLDVIAAPVNRADVKIRAGTWPIRADDPWPYTPGLEFVGTVTETGAEIDAFSPGDRATTMMQQMAGIHGARPGGGARATRAALLRGGGVGSGALAFGVGPAAGDPPHGLQHRKPDRRSAPQGRRRPYRRASIGGHRAAAV